jgi:prepilin-type N-terminal cleavage/methylation domain-containing protein
MTHFFYRQGFTLVEMVVVIGISSVLMVALAFMIFNFGTTYTYEQRAAQSARSASIVLRELESLVTPADQVLATHVFAAGTYSSGSNVLVVEIPSIDSNGSTVSNTYDYAAFYVSGANAYRLLEPDVLSSRQGGTKLLSATISSLGFTYDNADFTLVTTVTADVQTQVQVKQATASDRQQETIRLRNR